MSLYDPTDLDLLQEQLIKISASLGSSEMQSLVEVLIDGINSRPDENPAAVVESMLLETIGSVRAIAAHAIRLQSDEIEKLFGDPHEGVKYTKKTPATDARPDAGVRPDRNPDPWPFPPPILTRPAWPPLRRVSLDILQRDNDRDQYREQLAEIFGANCEINEEACAKYAKEIDWSWVGRHFLDRHGAEEYEKIYVSLEKRYSATIKKAAADLDRDLDSIYCEFDRRRDAANRQCDEVILSGRFPDPALEQRNKEIQNAIDKWGDGRARLLQKYMAFATEAHNEFVLDAARAFEKMAPTNLQQKFTVERRPPSI